MMMMWISLICFCNLSKSTLARLTKEGHRGEKVRNACNQGLRGFRVQTLVLGILGVCTIFCRYGLYSR
jgi:hypothetical protein